MRDAADYAYEILNGMIEDDRARKADANAEMSAQSEEYLQGVIEEIGRIQ